MNDGMQHLTGLVWSVSDLLRGDFKSSEYAKVILPFTVLRRLECGLEPTRASVAESAAAYEDGQAVPEVLLRRASGQAFYNTSKLTLRKIATDPLNAAHNLQTYVEGFSNNVREIFDRFEFAQQIRRLDGVCLLHGVVDKFAALDLRPDVVPDNSMGYLFEELIRRFATNSNTVVGEHFTPREVIQLMVNLLMAPDADSLSVSGVTRTVMDPACGTGGMLSVAEEHIKALNPDAKIEVYGQELHAESWALVGSDLILKGHDPQNIAYGNSLSDDGHPQQKFDYLFSNPPFGVEWKKVRDEVEREHRIQGDAGRFGAGLPRINDGSLLFLQHMISKMKPVETNGRGGSRLAIIFNASPLFAGAAGSGESEIRRWILENDWLEGVIALPDQLFYNTGLSAYFWILTNRKSPQHHGRVVLLDARDHWQRMRKSQGDKRKEFGTEHIREVTELYGRALEISQDPEHPLSAKVKVFRNEDFGYQRITVDRPLQLSFAVTAETLAALAAARQVQRWEKSEEFLAAAGTLLGSSWETKAQALAALKAVATTAGLSWPPGSPFSRAVRDAIGVRGSKGEIQRVKGLPEPDLGRREFRQISLGENVDEYFQREIRPQASDAWIDPSKTRVGFEIRPELFFSARLTAAFRPLEDFCLLEAARIQTQREAGEEEAEEGGDSHLREELLHLRTQDLHLVDSALTLPSPPEDAPPLTPCGGGDIVGRPGSWRLLPATFGEAVTHLTVLHPLEPRTGRALCEWLNSPTAMEYLPAGRDLMSLPVPADVILEQDFDDLLESVQSARHRLRVSVSSLLPNVFSGSGTNIQELRKVIQAADVEARLIGGLTQTLEDPVSRAEWSYPFHVAALARRYRISSIATSTHPAERMDSLLKLGEGIARSLGILALAELATTNREEFTKTLRQKFRSGATFGTWTTILNCDTGIGGRSIVDPDGNGDALALLKRIKDFRNNGPAHAHGVREMHEIENSADELEQLVLSTLTAVAWLATTHWDWVERCEYLDTASYALVKQRLRGSHPAWEPIEESSQYPLRPRRMYVGNGFPRAPLDLWPLVSVDVCSVCNSQELFLIDKAQPGGVITLRSLKEHPKEIEYPDI